MTLWIELALLLACIVIGARVGGIGMGTVAGFGPGRLRIYFPSASRWTSRNCAGNDHHGHHGIVGLPQILVVIVPAAILGTLLVALLGRDPENVQRILISVGG